MPRQTLRPFQLQGRTAIFTSWRKHRRVLGVAPTGSGKTTIFGDIAAQVTVPVLIVVHRRELARQARNRLVEFGVDHGLIMNGFRERPQARVQIASKDTLRHRIAKGRMPPAKLVIADEAHLSTAATWQTILDAYPDAKVLGVTATPWRLSGRSLADAYDDLVVIARPAELRAQGFLSPYVGFSYKAPDLSDVSTLGGEFNEQQTAAKMRDSAIVTDIVEKWHRYASHLTTICFCVNVEHSLEVTEQFRAAGVRVEHVDGKTPQAQRDAAWARLESGATQVVCNVGIAIEGIDVPRIKCVIDAAPTMSLSRALQKWGRGRRPWQNVTLRIHDHAFNITRHGVPDLERDYTLSSKPQRPPPVHTCQQCLAIYDGDACPSCGFVRETLPTGPREGVQKIAEAEQVDFSSDDAEIAAVPPGPARIRFIDVRWENPRVLEGELVKAVSSQTQHGARMFYSLLNQEQEKQWTFPGTSGLDALMAKVPVGSRLRVHYLGEDPPPPGRRYGRKHFKVEEWTS